MIVRIYTGEDSESHFEDLPQLPPGEVDRIGTKSGEDLVFRHSQEDSFSDWHHPTRRQYLIVLSGSMEVSVGDGSSRQFQPGDVLLAEDMTGQGPPDPRRRRLLPVGLHGHSRPVADSRPGGTTLERFRGAAAPQLPPTKTIRSP